MPPFPTGTASCIAFPLSCSKCNASLNLIELEIYFADHFDTILFPVLADIYFRQEDYRRARKVCNIGLGYHENDPEGRFLLAKVEKAEGNLKESERELEHSLKYAPDNP